ncbi:MAG: hypothetical protein ACC641_06990 [Acidiferrobacterales bacterium]
MKKSAQRKLKHKPNARHTLNEVLHSLQDLMHNELAEIADNGTGNASAETTVARSKEEVLESLRALIGKSKSATLLDVKNEGTPDTAMDELHGDNETMSTGLEVDSEPVATGADDVRNESSTPPPEDEFRLEMEASHKPGPNAENNRAAKNTSRQLRDTPGEPIKHGRGKQVEINWDDIPVLNDVVAPPPIPGSSTAREAREIAIKVAAMLNIEARKKGGEPTLDARTIMRLQSLLSQELQERQDESGEAEPADGTRDATGNDDA